VGLHPFRRKRNPGVGGKKVKIETRTITLTAVFAALYAVINVVQSATVGNPTIYGPIQLRIADALIPLAALIGWPVVGGVTIGCFVTNAYYFISPTDVILGPVANFIAAMLILYLRRRRLLACVVGALPIGFIVGGYLWLFFPPPDLFSAPAWLASIASITVSSIVSLAVIGYALLTVLSRKGIIEPLKSHGLKTLDARTGTLKEA
jgi:uncharacterized membrane protein